MKGTQRRRRRIPLNCFSEETLDLFGPPLPEERYHALLESQGQSEPVQRWVVQEELFPEFKSRPARETESPSS